MRIPPIVAAKMGWNEAQIFSARDVFIKFERLNDGMDRTIFRVLGFEPPAFAIAKDPSQHLNCSKDGGPLEYRGEFEINLKTYVQRQCDKCGVTEIFYEA